MGREKEEWEARRKARPATRRESEHTTPQIFAHTRPVVRASEREPARLDIFSARSRPLRSDHFRVEINAWWGEKRERRAHTMADMGAPPKSRRRLHA